MRSPLAALLLVVLPLAAAPLAVRPAAVVLDGPETTHQLLVTSDTDATHAAKYDVANPAVAHVSATGLIEPRAEGKTEIVVRHGGAEVRVPVEVKGIAAPSPVSFERQIMPLLTKAGCNSGGCHGKAEGQNGFKLSVFGFDPEADHKAIVNEARGRRVMPASPKNSLLVLKASGKLPHGGGAKILEGTLAHKRLVRWVAEGMKYRTPEAPPVVSLELDPPERVLALGGSQQIRVTALEEGGGRRCVTAEAEYDSNAGNVAGVDRGGKIQAGQVPGEAAVLVRHMGHVTFCRVTVPRTGVKFARPPEANFIDGHVWTKLEKLGIPPSDLCDDPTFLRRAYLDVIGTLPTADEARKFLADKDAKKRAKLIDALLERPEYADYAAMRWADLLRVDRDVLNATGSVAFTRWLREQFASNRPYDQFVRDVVTAEGKVAAPGAAGLFRVLEKPDVMSRSLSQVFLGIRIECAQCHHHPSDRWGQDDYLALAGFFSGVTRKGAAGNEAIVGGAGTDLVHPRTGKPVVAKALGTTVALPEKADRRQALADWMTAADNPYFARAAVNRLWAHYLGRGLVDPVDDLRATNPSANEPLLAALAKHFADSKYDLKAVTRTILNSRVYQLTGATKANADDEQNFSHATTKAMPAEVLLDAICQTTGVPEKYNGMPEGIRAIQMWDNRIPSDFLALFGRPARISVCACERSESPSIAQALHLLNAPEIGAKVHSRKGLARKLADSKLTPDAIIDELYLSTLSRPPTKDEKATLAELFSDTSSTRREAVEDALWALLNLKEFQYVR